jgi:outer membrane protein, heavy metal efflux system
MVVLRVGVDLPLFTHNRQDRELESALAMRDAAEAEQEDVRRKLDADVRRARAELAALGDRVRTYDEVIVPETGRAIDATLAAWRSGRGSLAQVLEARRAKLDAQLAQLDLSVAVERSKVDLLYLTEGAQR